MGVRFMITCYGLQEIDKKTTFIIKGIISLSQNKSKKGGDNLNTDKKAVISKIISAVNDLSESDSNKLILLMPFGFIAGQICKQNKTEKNDSANSIDVIPLQDVDIIPFNGIRSNMPFLTVLPDQILGVSSGNLEN